MISYGESEDSFYYLLVNRKSAEMGWDWQQSGPTTQTVEEFMNYFREVFGKPAGDTSIWWPVISFATKKIVYFWICSQVPDGMKDRCAPLIVNGSFLHSGSSSLLMMTPWVLRNSSSFPYLQPIVCKNAKFPIRISDALLPPANQTHNILQNQNPCRSNPPIYPRLSAEDGWPRDCLYCRISRHVLPECPIRPPCPLVSFVHASNVC